MHLGKSDAKGSVEYLLLGMQRCFLFAKIPFFNYSTKLLVKNYYLCASKNLSDNGKQH